MIKNVWHKLTGGAGPAPTPAADIEPNELPNFTASAELDRRSNGLRHFIGGMPKGGPLSLLELGSVNQSTLNFLGQLGCRIRAVDVLSTYDKYRETLPGGEFDARAAVEFVDRELDLPVEEFDGILAWDVLEFLDLPVLHTLIARLHESLYPGGTMLAFFHAQMMGQLVDVYRYQITGEDALQLVPRLRRPMPRTYNNRHLEQLFQDFHAVKFFLTRDQLREVIVSR